jgi:hypothetical protein
MSISLTGFSAFCVLFIVIKATEATMIAAPSSI